MKVLVTGSSGRVGSQLVRHLRQYHEVIGLDRREGPETTAQGEIDDRALLKRLGKGVDALVHTAALHAPQVGFEPESEFQRINVGGTQALLSVCEDAGIARFVYTSTTSLYGTALVPTDRAVWVTELLPPVPRDIYDQTKLQAEIACASAATNGVTCLSLRISRCFPEPEPEQTLYRLYRGLDLRDMAEAHRLALTAPVSGFDVFNISAQSPFTEVDTAELLVDATSVILRHCPEAAEAFTRRGWRLPVSIDRVYVIEKAKQVLGYSPRYNFLERLREL